MTQLNAFLCIFPLWQIAINLNVNMLFVLFLCICLLLAHFIIHIILVVTLHYTLILLCYNVKLKMLLILSNTYYCFYSSISFVVFVCFSLSSSNE